MTARKGKPVILAGDVGGTKSHLALLEPGGKAFRLIRDARYPSNNYASLNAIIREFLGPSPPVLLAAGFGVPGPVKEGRVRPTNLNWGVDGGEIGREFGIPQVRVLNDLAANAHGIAELKPSDFAVIHPGAKGASGNRCVVSPGTGLGEAGLFWNGKKYLVWACEGGHADFAPRTELDFEMVRHFRKQFDHVSCERVISGMGLENIYKFLRDTDRGEELPEVAEAMKNNSAGAVISKYADNGRCPMCAQTLEIFVACLGVEAGNMALKSMATGGVYLGGGIPAKILPRLKSVHFINAFTSKGRMGPMMEAIPVKVILNENAALLGAARQAVEALG